MTIKKLAFLCLLFTSFNVTYSTGIVFLKDANGLAKLNTVSVRAEVKNQISRVTSTQVFINNADSNQKIKYAFPLLEGANPISLRWKIGNGEWQVAEVSAEEQDTDIPSGSTGGGGSGSSNPSDIDAYLGVNPLFFEPNGELLPNQEITFELRYVQLLEYAFGEVSFKYPNQYSLIQSEPINSTTFEFLLDSDRSIEGLEIDDFDVEKFINTNTASLAYEGINLTADTDFNVRYTLNSEELGMLSMSTFLPDSTVACDAEGRGFVSFIIEPESNPDVEVIKKNFTLIIDRSGSMRGDKIDKAKEAAIFITNNLNDGDFFNIITFASSVNSFKPAHVPFSLINQAEALDFIDDIEAIGLTNIGEVLETSINQFGAVEDGKANIIIFFTDGIPTSGFEQTDQILGLVEDTNADVGAEITLFTFGVGEDVDKGLLTLLAQENSGLVEFLDPENFEEDLINFFLQINNPVLVNTQIEILPAGVIQSITPVQMPNLYKGQQLILSGRYEDVQDINISLTGNAFSIPVSYDFQIALSDSNEVEHSFLPKIWAKQKIDELALDYHLANLPVEQDAIEDDINQLSQCYGVVNVDFNGFTDSALEVEFVDFEGVVVDDRAVRLTWSTAMEINNNHFVIERCNDAANFEAIDKVYGVGNSTAIVEYEFIDLAPQIGINYYRLKQVDFNGNFDYSEIIAVIFDKDRNVMAIFPTVIGQGGVFFIDFVSDQPAKVQIIDPSGKIVMNQRFQEPGIMEVGDLVKGNYFCTLKVGSKTEIFNLIIN